MLPVGTLFTIQFPQWEGRGNETTNCPPDELSRNCSSPGSPVRSISSSYSQNSYPQTRVPTTEAHSIVSCSTGSVKIAGHWSMAC